MSSRSRGPDADLRLPGNQRKPDAVEQLRAVAEEAGSVILGPRAAGHPDDQLPAADVRIDDDISDAGQRRRAACLTESGPARAVLPDGDSRPGEIIATHKS